MPSEANNRSLHIKVDLNAIAHNLEVARAYSGGQKLFAVIKADAYGHGAVQVAKALEKADAFAVVTLCEAIELRDAGIDKPILVLQGAQSNTDFDACYQYKLWPVVHCYEQLDWLKNFKRANAIQPWLKIDSGMGRLGFKPADAANVIALNTSKQSTDNTGANWFGALTHFASADDSESTQTTEQIDVFARTFEPLQKSNPSVQASLANSAGLLAWPSSKADWGRPGIMLYGSNPLKSPSDKTHLKAAMTVSAPLISQKRFSAGDSIGYSATYTCAESMQVAFLAIGYGDGLPRVLDSSASVLLNGHECSILGRVSMDSIAIDLRGAGDISLGTHAVLWGAEHPVDKMAKAANTISYELLTSIRGVREYT